MTANMDVSLDEILAERKAERHSQNRRSDRNERSGRGRRDRDRRDDYPRDGVRKVGDACQSIPREDTD